MKASLPVADRTACTNRAMGDGVGNCCFGNTRFSCLSRITTAELGDRKDKRPLLCFCDEKNMVRIEGVFVSVSEEHG